eukprot:SAG11_NODE_23414_length_389_cov_0.534483_1_plen_49_part_10
MRGTHTLKVKLVEGLYYYIGLGTAAVNLNVWHGASDQAWSYYVRDNRSS